MESINKTISNWEKFKEHLGDVPETNLETIGETDISNYIEYIESLNYEEAIKFTEFITYFKICFNVVDF